jgi:hypothetical protein
MLAVIARHPPPLDAQRRMLLLLLLSSCVLLELLLLLPILASIPESDRNSKILETLFIFMVFMRLLFLSVFALLFVLRFYEGSKKRLGRRARFYFDQSFVFYH